MKIENIEYKPLKGRYIRISPDSSKIFAIYNAESDKGRILAAGKFGPSRTAKGIAIESKDKQNTHTKISDFTRSDNVLSKSIVLNPKGSTVVLGGYNANVDVFVRYNYRDSGVQEQKIDSINQQRVELPGPEINKKDLEDFTIKISGVIANGPHIINCSYTEDKKLSEEIGKGEDELKSGDSELEEKVPELDKKIRKRNQDPSDLVAQDVANRIAGVSNLGDVSEILEDNMRTDNYSGDIESDIMERKSRGHLIKEMSDRGRIKVASALYTHHLREILASLSHTNPKTLLSVIPQLGLDQFDVGLYNGSKKGMDIEFLVSEIIESYENPSYDPEIPDNCGLRSTVYSNFDISNEDRINSQDSFDELFSDPQDNLQQGVENAAMPGVKSQSPDSSEISNSQNYDRVQSKLVNIMIQESHDIQSAVDRIKQEFDMDDPFMSTKYLNSSDEKRKVEKIVNVLKKEKSALSGLVFNSVGSEVDTLEYTKQENLNILPAVRSLIIAEVVIHTKQKGKGIHYLHDKFQKSIRFSELDDLCALRSDYPTDLVKFSAVKSNVEDLFKLATGKQSLSESKIRTAYDGIPEDCNIRYNIGEIKIRSGSSETISDRLI